jgi:NAD(P)-dependent dehydrogenase (short-subunit alcohol dehydrogenase family)
VPPVEGSVALVSGGNRGIGLAVVRGLAEASVSVVMGSRDVASGEKAKSEIGSVPGSVSVVQLDVTDHGSITKCVESIRQDFGRLDVLVNNAGVTLGGGRFRATQPDFDLIRQTLDINLFGAWQLTASALDLMRESGPTRGRIINVSSGMGQLSEMGGGSPGYRLSKTGLNALTRMLSAELGDDFSVNSVCPGWVKTDLGGPHAHRTVEQGADTVVWLATMPEAELPTGGFFRDRQPIPW